MKKMSYNEAKKVLYETQNKRGIIFNVVATDTKTGLKSVYIPSKYVYYVLVWGQLTFLTLEKVFCDSSKDSERLV